jgi:putative membrane protein
MKMLAALAVFIVAALHGAFMALETFFWDHPVGRKIFSMTDEQSAATAVLAFNQGVYNGFLAAGLLWGLVAAKRDVQIFFLLCVVVAGAVGGATAKPTIWLTQMAPGLLALALVLAAGRAKS